ncbi:MAG: response regulator [Eisenbergiella sp.]
MSESRKYKIVFLDDEISTLTYLQYAVDWESLGITVCGTAQDGEKGLELIRKVNPDIVITDIRMPKYSGLDVLNVMREEQRNCRVVMLSAYADFEYARDALK